jgi:signal transduction histidine kinase
MRLSEAFAGPRRIVLWLVTLVCLATGTTYFVRHLLKPHVGLVTNFPEVVARDDGVYFAPKAPLSPAAASGLLQYKDRITRVNDYTVRSLRDVVEADLQIERGEPVEIEFVRGGTVMTLTFHPRIHLQSLEWIPSAVFMLLLAFTAIYLLLAAQLTSSTASMILACVTYAVFVGVKPYYYEDSLTNGLVQLGRLSPWLLVIFALWFPYPRVHRTVRRLTPSFVLVLFVAFVFVRLAWFLLWTRTNGDFWIARYRELGRIGNLFDVIAYILLLLLLLSAYFRTPLSRERRQLEWLLAGLLLGLTPYVFFEQLPLILGEAAVERVSTGAFANLFLLIVPLFFVAGIVQAWPMSLRGFLLNVLAWASLFCLAIGFYAHIYNPVAGFFMRDYSFSSNLAGLMAAVLFMMVAMFLRPVFVWLFAKLLSIVDEAVNRRVRPLRWDDVRIRRVGELEKARRRDLAPLARGLARRLRAVRSDVGTHLLQIEDALESYRRDFRPDDVRRIDQSIAEVRQMAADLGSLAETLSALGQPPLSKSERCDPNRIASRAVGLFRETLPAARVHLERHASARAFAVPQHIIAALRELMVNAWEAAPESEIEVVVDADTRVSRIEVRDCGPGIPPAQRRKLTRPFVTTKPDRPGLGLYLARSAVELSGGMLLIDDREGGGVAVTIVLPTDPPAVLPLPQRVADDPTTWTDS